MIVITTVDNNGGMLFNKRRVGRDEALIEWINRFRGEKDVWMNSYSSELFNYSSNNIVTNVDFLQEAAGDAICFNETEPLTSVEGRISKLIVCNWNRNYPSDVKLDLDLKKWKLVESVDIKGYAHEKITICTYTKKGELDVNL